MATPNELPTAVHKLDSLMVYLVGMILVWMGKKMMRRENMRENGWEEDLVRKGGWRENWTPEPTKNKSPQIREKAKKKICIFGSKFKKSFLPFSSLSQ